MGRNELFVLDEQDDVFASDVVEGVDDLFHAGAGLRVLEPRRQHVMNGHDGTVAEVVEGEIQNLMVDSRIR
jgi:hypothetical protein